MDLLFSNRQLDLPDCKSFSRLIKICSHEFKKHYWITIRENELATYTYLEKTTMYSYSKRTNCWICDIGFLWPFEKKSLCVERPARETISLTWWRRHYRWRAAQFRLIYPLTKVIEWDLYRVTLGLMVMKDFYLDLGLKLNYL